jgi:hypothetical protein
MPKWENAWWGKRSLRKLGWFLNRKGSLVLWV